MSLKGNGVAIALLLFVTYTLAQVNLPGAQCPQTSLQPNFDIPKYMGLWYEYSKYSTFYEQNRKCTSNLLKYVPPVINVRNSGVDKKTNQPGFSLGTATVLGNAKFLVQFSSSTRPSQGVIDTILGTDYVSYSVLSSCVPIPSSQSHNMSLWIVTREAMPKASVLENAVKVIKDNKLSLDYLVKTDHNNCPAPSQ